MKHETDTLKLDILNRNIEHDEVAFVIKTLKNNKSPGLDGIPAEYIKNLQEHHTDFITTLFNYIIEKRTYPDKWAEGLRIPIPKKMMINLDQLQFYH
jgi:hypothetical protein